MKYCIYHSSYPVVFSSCGNLVSDNGFIHPKRNIDSLYCSLSERVLYISLRMKMSIFFMIMNFLYYSLIYFTTVPGAVMVIYLITGHIFIFPILLIRSLIYFIMKTAFYPFQNILQVLQGHVVLPETGTVSSAGHSQLLFLQLMDIACREHYKDTYKCHYGLSLLLLEFCSESLSAFILQDMDIPPRLSECIDWIQLHYNQPLTASDIANRFNYNPAYLTSLFKKYTGYSLTHYINHARISAAKNLLTNQDQTIEAIAKQCGFTDTKYFYRIFKKEEHITPSEYRNAFHHKKLVL